MLVLTRRVDESICIGDNIRITVVQIKGSQQISVGIDAPRDVLIVREELVVDRAGLVGESGPSRSQTSQDATYRYSDLVTIRDADLDGVCLPIFRRLSTLIEAP